MTTLTRRSSGTGGEPTALRPVEDVMHRRVVSCAPETPLRDVARMMSTYRIHAVVVHDHDGGDARSPWAVVSDRDVVSALVAGELDKATAATAAATEFLTIAPEEPLSQAAGLLHEHEVAHLVVVDSVSGRPLGVLSTLDIAAAVGGQA